MEGIGPSLWLRGCLPKLLASNSDLRPRSLELPPPPFDKPPDLLIATDGAWTDADATMRSGAGGMKDLLRFLWVLGAWETVVGSGEVASGEVGEVGVLLVLGGWSSSMS